MDVEGHAVERLVGKLYEERGRKGLPGFVLTQRIAGYWDGAQADIDLVALNEEDQAVRFGTIKRDPSKLRGSFSSLRESIDVFLKNHPRLRKFRRELVAVAPELNSAERKAIEQQGLIAQDLKDLWNGPEPKTEAR